MYKRQELGHLIGNGPLRVHKSGEDLIGDHTVFQDHSTDLGDPILSSCLLYTSKGVHGRFIIAVDRFLAKAEKKREVR